MKEFLMNPKPQTDVASEETGISLISAERFRQVSEEGWTPEHDDAHRDGGLADAAACYAMTLPTRFGVTATKTVWPWEFQWWKPVRNDRVRELVKAGALIAAEIDRLLRARSVEPVSSGDSRTGVSVPATAEQGAEGKAQ